MSKLKDKVAVVTGASKGIGAGIAKSLAAEGASVVVNYSTSKDEANKVVAEIKKEGGKAVAVQGDVSRAADVERLFTETKKTFGKLDVLVNNAGIYLLAPLEQITEDQFHRQFNTNVLGLLMATQEAAKLFGPEGGSVIKYRIDCHAAHAADFGSLFGDQRRGGRGHARSGQGAWTEKDSRELHQSRHG